MPYHSETAKVRDLHHVMMYVRGRVCDVGAGNDKITPDALALDGRQLTGVDVVKHNLYIEDEGNFDTIFSSHFLEHTPDPFSYVMNWYKHLNQGGHLVLYLPQKDAYNSHENPEHMWNWSYDDFMFWFKRSFCGEGKDYKGNHLPTLFHVMEHGLDIGEDKYSFYLVAMRA